MGAWTEIVDYTVPSNTTSVTLNSFGTITKNDFIKVVASVINNSGQGSYTTLLANSSVSSNYHRQELYGIGSATGAGRSNAANVFGSNSGKNGAAIGYLKLSENDRLNCFFNYTRDLGSGNDLLFTYSTSSGATFSSGITSLTFTMSETNGWGTGSRIQIYRLDAEKVADITVASNTTQVDISSLSIGKDSEYLLVSDLNNSTGSTADYFLTPNDLTTQSGYYVQRLIGNGTSAGALRTNQSRYTETFANTRVVAYTHIKLSEIGAYTSQSYGLDQIGTSTPRLLNYFISSTSEAITSITKLNVIGAVSNSIGSGTRFILYKLK